MNKIILEKHEKIYDIICEKYKKTKYFKAGPFDETFFSLQVYRIAKQIISQINCDSELVLISCLLHDIGKTKINEELLFTENHKQSNWKLHPKLGVDIAKEILNKLNYENDFIEKVIYLVENHDNRINFNGEKTIELQILQDSDYIADGGIFAPFRVMLYGGQFKRGILDSINYYLDEKPRCNNYEILNLDISKKISKEMYEKEKIIKSYLREII